MIFIGIDIGLDGGIASIGDDGPKVWPMPTLKVGNRRRLNTSLICRSARQWHTFSDVLVMVEDQTSFQQGRTSAFTLGKQVGIWECALIAFEVPHQFIRPRVWQSAMLQGYDGGGKTKAASIQTAQRLFPDVSLRRTDRCEKDHDGMSDALLIAEYARRTCA